MDQIISEPIPASDPALYIRGMERLLKAVQELSLARELTDVQRIVSTVARELTGSDGATIVLNDQGRYCYYADEDAIEPLWKGKRFPQEICISGWVMQRRQPAIIPDIYVDSRIPHEAYRPTFVRSLAMVPIRTPDPLGAIGNYWASHHVPTEIDMRLLQALADATSVAIQSVNILAELEERVQARTQALSDAHVEIQTLAITDELTGLYNRRGFYERAAEALRADARILLAFVDVDGLKRVNDAFGHARGDAMLVEIARELHASFRSTDIVARMGGDEFCVLVIDPTIDGETFRDVFRERINVLNEVSQRDYRLSASIGLVEATARDIDDLDHLIADADRRMYEEKAKRRAIR